MVLRGRSGSNPADLPDSVLDKTGLTMVLFSARLIAWFGGKWTNLLVKESFDCYPAVRLRGPCTSTTLCGRVAEGHCKLERV